MSYDKNTINMSSLDMVKEILGDLGYSYLLIVQVSVRGRGFNDSRYHFENDDHTREYDLRRLQYYNLRRLQYGNWVILERIERTADCDADDTITSHKFRLEDEPKDWKYTIEEVGT